MRTNFVDLIVEWQSGRINLDTVMWRTGFTSVPEFLAEVKKYTVVEENENNLRGSGMTSGTEVEIHKIFPRRK